VNRQALASHARLNQLGPLELRGRTRPQLLDDLKFGKTVPNVVDYSTKIKMLDPTFELTDAERDERTARYSAFIRRRADAEAASQRRHDRTFP
jgi:hypothetical protein